MIRIRLERLILLIRLILTPPLRGDRYHVNPRCRTRNHRHEELRNSSTAPSLGSRTPRFKPRLLGLCLLLGVGGQQCRGQR